MRFIKKLSAAVSAIAVTATGLCSALPASIMTGISASADTNVYGDANSDGKFDIRDAAFIANRLANQDIGAVPSSIDCTGDSIVNIRDAAAIASRLSSDYQIKRMIEVINNDRVKKGISPVTIDERITGASMVRAKETATKFSHTRPDNNPWSYALDDFKADWLQGYESGAGGFYGADETFEFLSDTSDYEYLMSSTYNRIGVGFCYSPSSLYKYYWVIIVAESK